MEVCHYVMERTLRGAGFGFSLTSVGGAGSIRGCSLSIRFLNIFLALVGSEISYSNAAAMAASCAGIA